MKVVYVHPRLHYKKYVRTYILISNLKHRNERLFEYKHPNRETDTYTCLKSHGLCKKVWSPTSTTAHSQTSTCSNTFPLENFIDDTYAPSAIFLEYIQSPACKSSTHATIPRPGWRISRAGLRRYIRLGFSRAQAYDAGQVDERVRYFMKMEKQIV